MITANTNQKGVTIIQVLIPVAVVGIVILIFSLLLASERKSSRDYMRVSNINQLQSALELFYSQNGSYPATAAGPVRGGSGRNWLPNIEDAGIRDSFGVFLLQDLIAPIPADSATCRARKICNGDNQALYNDFCYTAYPEECSAAGDIKCSDFLLDFCVGKQTGQLPAGRYSITRDGMRFNGR